MTIFEAIGWPGFFSGLALLIAIAAFFLSVRSVEIAHQMHDLAKKIGRAVGVNTED